jgi:hypothetical protein
LVAALTDPRRSQPLSRKVSGEPGIDLFTIDKSPKFQSLVMKSVLEAVSAQS